MSQSASARRGEGRAATKVCAACGSRTEPSRHGAFAFFECSSCGYAVLAEGGNGADYWRALDVTHDYWTAARESYFEGALGLLADLALGRRLVDIGGGVGFFAERALAAGWDAYSFDISPTVAAAAAERLGEARSLTALGEAETASFDAACLWCVVAHTDDPLPIAEAAARVLRQDGVLWLTTPNFAFQRPYAWARSKAGRPLDFQADDHVGHFTAAAIRALLERAGFHDVRFHFRGITETCVVAGNSSRPLLVAKRGWNLAAAGALRVGLPNAMSELQVTARRG